MDRLPGDMIRLLADRYIDSLHRHVLRCVCKRFSSIIPLAIPFLNYMNGPLCSEPYELAIDAGSVSMLQWISTYGIGKLPRPCALLPYLAARSGSLAIVEWLIAAPLRCDPKWVIDGAISGAYLPILDYADEKRLPVQTSAWFDAYCRFSNDANVCVLLEWLHRHGCPPDGKTCRMAARYGRVDVLEWLSSKGEPMLPILYCTAVERNQIDVLRWLLDRHVAWHVDTFTIAASESSIETIEWLHRNECPWNVTTCLVAAENNRWDIVRWLHRYECPWDESICRVAIQRGDRDALRWLRTNGCPWNEDLRQQAAFHLDYQDE